MKSSLRDLYECFENHLGENGLEYASDEEFIQQVTQKFCSNHPSVRQVPGSFIEDFREEIAESVREMLKKKTYGYFSLRDFQLNKKTQ